MNDQKSKQNQKPVATIDEKHNELLEYFHRIETVRVPEIETEIQTQKGKIKTLKENQIEQYFFACRTIDEY